MTEEIGGNNVATIETGGDDDREANHDDQGNLRSKSRKISSKSRKISSSSNNLHHRNRVPIPIQIHRTSEKRGSKFGVEAQLPTEIKQLYKEASALSQPSTFAQAAKLRRMAAAKEKDLAKIQELHSKEMKLSYDSYLKGLTILKVFTYFSLICWFWRVPVDAVSKQLVEPFGKVLSWRAGSPLNENVMVGIIPWLILFTRVSIFICRRVFN